MDLAHQAAGLHLDRRQAEGLRRFAEMGHHLRPIPVHVNQSRNQEGQRQHTDDGDRHTDGNLPTPGHEFRFVP